MSHFPHYRDAPESIDFPLPFQSLGCGLSHRVRDFARRIPRSAVFGMRTAAWLHGLDVLPRSVDNDCWPVEVIVPRNVALPSRRGLRVYTWDLGCDVVSVDGLLATTRTRTALDCARVLPRLDAVAAVDQFLRNGVPLPDLRRYPDAMSCRTFAHAIHSILDIADPRADSPLESWTRCLIVDAGLPRPETQVPVSLHDGTSLHLDLGYPEFKLGIECNGMRYHTDEARLRDDQRRDWIVHEGWSVLTVYGSDVVVRPDGLLAEVQWRLRHRGWKPTPHHLDRVAKRIRYIAMSLRLTRQEWNAAWGVT